MVESHSIALFPRFFQSAITIAVCLLAACASNPPHHVVTTAPPVAPPRPSTEVYFYPTRGQTPERQDRDRYDCYLWATKQTGFDPSTVGLAPTQRVHVRPAPPPGHDAATDAAAGAVLGAVVTPPGRRAEGAIAGAVTGAIIGTASDNAREEHAAQVEQRLNDQNDAARAAALEHQASNYRRAMGACLEGRGYTVR